MSLADSEAAFEQHCAKLVADGSLHGLLARHDIRSLSSLAFAIGTPQSPPSDEQFKDFCTRVNEGVEMNFGTQAAVRRLHFEASAVVMAELKAKATDSTSDISRKLPVAEKAARLREQESRLTGMRIRGELQPAYALIDIISQMKESNSVVWVAPSRCGKRDSEVQSSMKEKPVTLSLEQQMVKLSAVEEPAVVDTSTDLQLQWAMQRRGLAFDQCSLIGNAEHEIWVQQLLSQLTRDPPAGFSRVTTSQLIRADRELFTIMAQEIQGTLQPDASGEFPMEKKLKELRTDPRVTMHLLPLPKGAPKEAEKPAAAAPSKPQGGNPGPKKKQRTTPSAKAKSLCPPELKQYSQKDKNGTAICWAYNQKSGCANEVTNGRCKKGVHICMKCHRNNHSVVTCRSS